MNDEQLIDNFYNRLNKNIKKAIIRTGRLPLCKDREEFLKLIASTDMSYLDRSNGKTKNLTKKSKKRSSNSKSKSDRNFKRKRNHSDSLTKPQEKNWDRKSKDKKSGKKPIICYNCEKEGYIFPNCPEPPTEQTKARREQKKSKTLVARPKLGRPNRGTRLEANVSLPIGKE
ncbi:hypothetical protein B7494_g8442 [Chlorociboria aeruginascens]|nr:hypothetical protein B7494_g8442 [Chlorociboria aeruginascens]